MNFLRQSTTVTVQVGPFIDRTDGYTAETALSPTVQISKAGAVFAARSSATAITHDADGFYRVELNTTDTGTVGRLLLKSFVTADALPVWHEFVVVPAAIYDSLVAGSDTLPVDLTQIDGLATSGTNATLNLKQLNIVNSAGSAIIASSTGSNGSGLAASGHGTGHGIHATAGATGHGLRLVGGATSGDGLNATVTSGDAVGLYGAGSSRSGLYAEATGGPAVTFNAQTSSGADAALRLIAGPGGSGLVATGNAAGSGIVSAGGATGHGLLATGGATSGDAIRGTVTSGSAFGDALVDSILDRSISEPTSIWAWPASLRKVIGWLGLLSRNKMTQTNTTQIVRNDADSANVASSTHSDDGTTFTRGEWS